MTDTLKHLLDAAGGEGVTVSVTPAGKVKLSGPTASLAKWRSVLAPHKAAILERDLEQLIREAAAYWQYDADDLRLIRQTARADPDGLRLALATDPLRPYYAPPPPPAVTVSQAQHQCIE